MSGRSLAHPAISSVVKSHYYTATVTDKIVVAPTARITATTAARAMAS